MTDTSLSSMRFKRPTLESLCTNWPTQVIIHQLTNTQFIMHQLTDTKVIIHQQPNWWELTPKSVRTKEEEWRNIQVNDNQHPNGPTASVSREVESKLRATGLSGWLCRLGGPSVAQSDCQKHFDIETFTSFWLHCPSSFLNSMMSLFHQSSV